MKALKPCISHLLPFFLLSCTPLATSHSHHHHDQESLTPPSASDASRLATLRQKWGSDFSFSGLTTFAHLPHTPCLLDPAETFDIGIIGVPFDTAVTYRPGARFGPRAIRAASMRQGPLRGFNPRARINPYQNWAKVVECGDVPVTPFDNALALRMMSEAYAELAGRSAAVALDGDGDGGAGVVAYKRKSKLVSLGGDHSIALPALRALKEKYGRPITVVHFDAHLDTWHPAAYPSSWLNFTSLSAERARDGGQGWDEQSFFTHGNMFWLAHLEGLIEGPASVHAGLRTRLSGVEDEEEDERQGWLRIASDEIDELGWKGVAERIVERVTGGKAVGLDDAPVYLSVDIDVIDPGLCPGTGTPEPGGWSTRELIRVLRGIEGLNVVGADVVEVSPSYDGAGEQTATAAAVVAYEIMTSMVKRGLMEEEWNKAGAGGIMRDEL